MDKLVVGNRRKDLRIPFKSNVRFSADQFNWYLDRSQNVSKRGLFIETEKMFKVGSRIYLHFNLMEGDHVKKIKAIGKVVRLGSVEEVGRRERSGIGIRFSLLPSEDRMICSFIEGIVNYSVPVSSSSLHQSATHIYGEAKGSPASLFKWWLKEIVSKACTANGLIVELVFLVVIILIVFRAFL